MTPYDGQVAINKRTGQRAVFQNGQWVSSEGKPQVQEAGMRSRMDLGLGPMVSSNEAMIAQEAKGNPYSYVENPTNGLAKTLKDADILGWSPFEKVAKFIGGDDFQAYEQAAAGFESQLMPIMSGAAVSASEAKRQIRAQLPELGDSPAILATKANMRKQMLNGAAKARGVPLPYPDVPTWSVNTLNPSPPKKPKAQALPKAGQDAYMSAFNSGQIDRKQPRGTMANPYLARSLDVANRLPKGSYVFLPDGSLARVK